MYDTAHMQDVVRRLERLEQRFRVVKLSLILCALLTGALLIMGQSPTAQILRVQKIVLSPTGGNAVPNLSVPELEIDSTGLTFRGSNGEVRTAYGADMVLMRGGGGGTVLLTVGGDGPLLSLNSGDNVVRISTSATATGPYFLNEPATNAVRIFANVGGPRVDLSDRAGFVATIGAADLQTAKTGETQKTSAASMVLSAKDKKVIWRAP